MKFNDSQLAELKKPLDPKSVKTLPTKSKAEYVEGWHVINEANRIFGFDGWSLHTVICREVCNLNVTIGDNKAPGFKVGYEAKVSITAGGVTREGTGFGSGIAKDLCDAIEGAIKEAETDATKRALRLWGNVFGLALYDKQKKAVKDVETYEMDTRKIDVLKAEIIDKLNKSINISALSKNWAVLVKDINQVKSHNKDWYIEIMDIYTKLKKGLPNDNT